MSRRMYKSRRYDSDYLLIDSAIEFIIITEDDRTRDLMELADKNSYL